MGRRSRVLRVREGGDSGCVGGGGPAGGLFEKGFKNSSAHPRSSLFSFIILE